MSSNLAGITVLMHVTQDTLHCCGDLDPTQAQHAERKALYQLLAFKFSNTGAMLCTIWASLVVHLVKNLPAVQETQVQSRDHGKSPGEGDGNLIQYSCLENPTDRGAWWATVRGAAQSRTRLSD